MTDTQRFTGTATSVAAGGTLTVHFTNTALANQTVTVTVCNAGSDEEDSLQIQLGADGSGSAPWSVPSTGWGDGIILKQEASADWTVVVT